MKRPELRADLQLFLFTGIFNGLEDVPGVPPPHLQVGHVAPEPSLDQNSCLDSCRKTHLLENIWSHVHTVPSSCMKKRNIVCN